MTENLAPSERIRKKKEFLYLYKKGHRYKSKYFSLIYLSNSLAHSRVGVVASRKIGGAVARNRAKRWMRELYRRNKVLLTTPVDLILVALPAINEATWAELKECYIQTVGKIFEKQRTR
ncbi:MAG: ribonuclease P protein component [Acidobacteriota bacterium]